MIRTFQNTHEDILAEFQSQQPFESLTFTPFAIKNYPRRCRDYPKLNEEKKMDQTLLRKYLTQEL